MKLKENSDFEIKVNIMESVDREALRDGFIDL
jgi:hypothetical protein